MPPVITPIRPLMITLDPASGWYLYMAATDATARRLPLNVVSPRTTKEKDERQNNNWFSGRRRPAEPTPPGFSGGRL